MKTPLQVSVVVPVLDEAPSLRQLDRELRAALADLSGPAEIVYVDDGSKDDSRRILRTIVAEDSSDVQTRAVLLRRNFGQSTALGVGFRLARGAVIVPLDADGQNNPADIPRLLARHDEGFDVVSGWRRNRQDKAFSRRFPSWAANRLISRLSGVSLNDHGCTLKAYRAELLQQIHLHGEMHRFIPVFLAPLGARITELEVDHRPRQHGASHYGSDRVLKVLLDLVTIRFVSRYAGRPMHFFGQAALLFLGLLTLTFGAMLVFKNGWLRWVGIDYQASFIQTPLPALVGTFFLGLVMSLFFGVLGESIVRLNFDLRDPAADTISQVIGADGTGSSEAPG